MRSSNKKAKPTRLGPLEQAVLEILWDHGPATVRQVINHLGTDAAYTTIATVLNNLERKNLAASSREGRSTFHKALMTREMFAAQMMGYALSSSRDRTAAILHFVDSIDPREADLLRDYLVNRDLES